jgi:hypothetical protein
LKFLLWSVGAFTILLGLEQKGLTGAAWGVAWWALGGLWLLVGGGLLLVSVARTLAGKLGAGVLTNPRRAGLPTPAPKKEEL